MKIKVIDSLCGSGKTTYIFNHIKANANERWLYVSPYLTEVGNGNTKGRIQTTLPELSFQSPMDSDYGGKLSSLKELLDAGENIAVTHQLYKNLTPSLCNLIEQQGYNLVIDETVDLITMITGVTRHDIDLLKQSGIVAVDEITGKVRWKQKDYKGRYYDIKKLAESETLYVYKDYILVTKLSPTLLSSSKSVYILTYLFESSVMRYFMEIHNIQYEYYYPSTLRSAKELKQQLRDNLEILPIPRKLWKMQLTSSNGLPNNAFMSSSWFDKVDDSVLEDIRVSLESVVKNNFKSGNKVFWTTFKKVKPQLESSRFKREFCEILEEDYVDVTELQHGWVPKNQRASNEYADCNSCIIACNTFMYLPLKRYLNDCMAKTGVCLRCDDDNYALSELVQFIFRGTIRKNQPMQLLIVSNRMKMLFEDWLRTDK